MVPYKPDSPLERSYIFTPIDSRSVDQIPSKRGKIKLGEQQEPCQFYNLSDTSALLSLADNAAALHAIDEYIERYG